MAESPTHKLGQIIGKTLQDAGHTLLDNYCKHHGLLLQTDFRLTDSHGNVHQIDFGLYDERDQLRAIIEAGYRSFKKHSRAKAQEIQAAVLPLVETYRVGFHGVICGGVWTDGAMVQLQSHGFHVSHIPQPHMEEGFASVGVDIRRDQFSSDESATATIAQLAALSETDKISLRNQLLDRGAVELDRLCKAMDQSIFRCITEIRRTPGYLITTQYSDGNSDKRFDPAELLDFGTAYGRREPELV